MCNNCVHGFDHHCTLLNNCIGKRNLRVFICLLLSACIFYIVTGVIAAIAILYEPNRKEFHESGTIHVSYDIVVSSILVVL